MCGYRYTYIQPIADRVTKNLEIISKDFQFGARRTRILMGFVMSTMLLPGTDRKSHGQDCGSLNFCRDDLKIFCHPICNRLYICMYTYTYRYGVWYMYIHSI